MFARTSFQRTRNGHLSLLRALPRGGHLGFGSPLGSLLTRNLLRRGFLCFGPRSLRGRLLGDRRFGGGDLCRVLAASIAFRPRSPTDRILATAFLMGSFPFADEFPTSAPATPPATAPTGPATMPPMTAPVTPPAVCFETVGRLCSLIRFFTIVFVSLGVFELCNGSYSSRKRESQQQRPRQVRRRVL